MRTYRSRHRAEFVRLGQWFDSVMMNIPSTRLAFEKKIGKRQRQVVVVQRIDGQSVPLFTGRVVEFLPFERVSVLRESGQVVKVALAEVERDPDYGVWWRRPSAKPPETVVTTKD
jgi:hypothetical protein